MNDLSLSSTDRIIARKEGAVGWILFNNPARRNAVSMDMWAAIPKIVEAYEADPEIRVLVLTGAGDKAFVSGADISEFEQQRSNVENVKAYDEVAGLANKALVGCGKPTIAMIRGWCIGGGVGVTLTCDFRIASDDARFGVPAARLGLGYDMNGIRRLVDVVGPSYAKEIFFTARHYTADEAHEMGLVNRVVPAAELEDEVARYTGMIAENAPLTIAAVKRAVREIIADESARDSAAVNEMVEACFASEDYKEGRTAFMEKRKPVFRGR
ncbi:MAG: enoyl-CoA hydratase [Pseudomonadota bacterium]